MDPPRPARILHTSDCHLDKVDDGLRQRAFAASIDLSIELNVDLLLITGDLFDHDRIHDPILDWAAEQLDRANRPIVLLVGNHDCLDERSVHHRFAAESRCRQVQFIDDPMGMTVEVPGTDIVVWGRAMVDHVPSFRPLSGSPPRSAGRWNVIAGHGLVVGAGADTGRSSLIFLDDIESLEADYVALGHIHAHEVLRERPLTAYAGATPYSLNGRPGCVIVDLVDMHAPQLTWTELTPRASVVVEGGLG
jgi:DNA repair protein SbcD/Mre11